MKKLFFIIAFVIAAITLGIVICHAAALNLKATWTPNTEVDMASYNLYRTDGSRLKLNPVPIPHPPVLPYSFIITVPDNSSGTATFVLTAVDTAGNESVDSLPASWAWDLVPPARPANLIVTFP